MQYLRSKGGVSGSTNLSTNFITAAAMGDINEVQTLLELSSSSSEGFINQGDYDRRSALHLAAGGRPY